jgi:hypothetical protein
MVVFRSCLLVLFLFAGGAVAGSESFSISQMYLRTTMAGMSNSAGYVIIANQGATVDRLLSVRSSIARKVEIHSMKIVDGVMQMRQVDAGLQIGVGEELALIPGSFHIMLMGLNTELATGSHHDMTLVFEKAGEITVKATAKLPSEIATNIATRKHKMD